jgi:UBX domain-containing protein 1
MEDHRHEAYKAPPMKPFSGSGQRLGALLPGVVEQPPVIAAAAPVVPAASPSRPAGPQTVNVAHFDASAPLTHVQMRLADGQRLIITGNLTSTVGDLREAIVK